MTTRQRIVYLLLSVVVASIGNGVLGHPPLWRWMIGAGCVWISCCLWMEGLD